MNAYQKATILLTGALLPLLLLFLRGMGYPGTWIAGTVAVGLSAALVYALRNAQGSARDVPSNGAQTFRGFE